ncbi:MAG: Polysaccharide biosynthesis protein [candidate division WWE3 bacterium GW2011_GWF2_41_45]|uniref:Polysaccharide biosynthesis protein C-terminal domain-containing protein n=3 Tax=Katanobacteria TaxID=422282 RepID=A0A1F4W3I7_UNCKA|nr:MAG: Polysaccharide biosynthesis protein [candidate division WWE3 bacterium GW2011_GWC2_41_23]KKS10788.1 MAG: Polysaccharide biosynthesis protein [candidate division WWE3 bacterium GW2011_GWF2_41_45]KKS12464.1 MAG: Polysaccharide biosynthesis protein [candidate division WWE3 bacterium GW2011_GWF1_41_53]KKS20157.1 MAG: Polysaccharide biosynthesis protein [candidate division WWE3 bacterium GW2011_GWE1_41_72]KKS28725.1 MAG: Polysaccharide biosynthesis protein [candidate division WWE3 bacterium 
MIGAFIQKVKTNKYLMGTVYIGVGSVLASIFSYLLQFVFGRILSVADFGTFNALISLSYLVGVPAGVFSVSLIKYVSELSSRQDSKKLTAMYWKLLVISLVLGVGISLAIFLLRFSISEQLKINDTVLITVYGISMGLAFAGAIPASYFQGLLRYRAYAFFNVLSSFYRFGFSVLAVLLGFKLAGAFGGMFVAGVLALLTAFFILRKNLTVFENISLMEDYKRLLAFSLPVMFVSFGLMFLNNIDIILVKKYFDPEMAGYYAGTVTLGKIFLFGAGAVSTVMFPTISSLAARGLNYGRAFFKFLSLQLVLVAGGLVAFSLFPSFLTRLFFGERFMNSVEYLPVFSLFIGLYIVINFLVLFFLAVNRTSVFLLLLPGLIVQYVLINSNHATLYNVISADIYAGIISLVLLSVFFIVGNNGKRATEI